MKVFNSSNHQIVELEAKPFAKGGEGCLHRVVSGTGTRPLVAKLFYSNKRTKQRHYKLKYLISHPPHFEHSEQAALLCWPIALLQQEQVFVGYLMPFVEGIRLEELCMPKLSSRLGNLWTRFDWTHQESDQLRQKLCFNIAVAVHHIHQTKRYTLVDLKAENIIVKPNGLVCLVDIDSIQISDSGKLVFPAAVATPEFAPPEYHQSNKATLIDTPWDTFAMAILFYRVLLGIHPFAASSQHSASSANSLSEKIRLGLFVHNIAQKSYIYRIPAPHFNFKNLGTPIQYLFNLCFIDGIKQASNRPTADSWCRALSSNRLPRIDSHFEVPNWTSINQYNVAKPPQLRVFEHSFKRFFTNWYQDNKTAIIRTLADQLQLQKSSWFRWLAILSLCLAGWPFFTASGYVGNFVGSVCLLLISILAFLVYRLQLDKRGLKAQQTSFVWPLIDIPEQYRGIFKGHVLLIQQCFKNQQNKLIGLEISVKEGLRILQDKRQTTRKQQELEIERLAHEKRTCILRRYKERNNATLWQEYAGANYQEKINFLTRQYLPQQCKQLEKIRQDAYQKADNLYLDRWPRIEKQHYEALDAIDADINNNRVATSKKIKAQVLQEVYTKADTSEKMVQVVFEKELKELRNDYFEKVALQQAAHRNKVQQLSILLENYFTQIKINGLTNTHSSTLQVQLNEQQNKHEQTLLKLKKEYQKNKEKLRSTHNIASCNSDQPINKTTDLALKQPYETLLRRMQNIENRRLNTHKIILKQTEEFEFVQQRQTIIDAVQQLKSAADTIYNHQLRQLHELIKGAQEGLTVLEDQFEKELKRIQQDFDKRYKHLLEKIALNEKQSNEKLQRLQTDFQQESLSLVTKLEQILRPYTVSIHSDMFR